MKRFFFTLAMAACVLAAMADVADDRKNEITIGVGTWSAPNFVFSYFANDIVAQTNAAGKIALENMQWYGSYSFNYHHQLKHFFALGVKATFDENRCDVYSTDNRPSVVAVMGSNHEFVGHSDIKLLSAMLSMQFTYLNTGLVKLYSGIDLGVGVGIWKRTDVWNKVIPEAAMELDPDLKRVAEVRDKYKDGTDVYALPAFDITPIGVKVGTRFYGLAEINIGMDSLFKLGFGVRF